MNGVTGVPRSQILLETFAQWNVAAGLAISTASPLVAAAAICVSVSKCSLAAAVLVNNTMTGSQGTA